MGTAVIDPPVSFEAVRDGEPLLRVSGLTLQYKTREHLVTATSGVDFQVFGADRFVILGPSGCGKSTLLKAIGGFIAPVEGTIMLKGKPVERPGPDRIMVFQEFDQLLPWMTVAQNVAFPMKVSRRWKTGEIRERAHHFICLLYTSPSPRD